MNKTLIGVNTWCNHKGCLEFLQSLDPYYYCDVIVVEDQAPEEWINKDDRRELKDFTRKNLITHFTEEFNRGVYGCWNIFTRHMLVGNYKGVIISNDDITLFKPWDEQFDWAINDVLCNHENYTSIIWIKGVHCSFFWLNPACAMKVGMFDDHFRYHGGDFDYLFRAHYMGFDPMTIVCDRVVHHGSPQNETLNIRRRALSERDNRLLVWKYSNRWHEVFNRFEWEISFKPAL